MKKQILVISDSFKGSLSSISVGNAIKKGIHEVCPQNKVTVFSVSDGGEGFIDSLSQKSTIKVKTHEVVDLLFRPSKAKYGVYRDTIFIESAQTCGINLLNHKELNPTETSSYGLGLQLKKLINDGYRKFIIGLGGTATNDGGAGALYALGYSFYAINNEEIVPNGGNLNQIHYFKKTNLNFRNISIYLASDVSSPLLGKKWGNLYLCKTKRS